MIIVNYEVYVLEQPRGWMLHARFPRQERETALAEAKELETTLSVRVKVVRETYYSDDNLFEEAEVYISGMKGAAVRQQAVSQTQRPASKPSGPAPSRRSVPAKPARRTSTPARKPQPKAAPAAPAPAPAPIEDRTRSKKAAKAHHLVARLLAITGVSLVAALMAIKVTPNIIMFLWNMGFHLNITPDGYGQLLFLVFVLVFLMTAVPLAIRFLPRQTEIPAFHKPHLSWRHSQRPKVSKELQKSLDKLANQALMEEIVAGKGPGQEEDAPLDLSPPAEELPEIKPDPDALLAEMERKQKAEEEKRRQEDAAVADPPADKKVDAPAAQEAGAVTAESQIATVNRFLNGAVNAVKASVKVLDSYNKFALHLYMAGGIETLCDFRKIGEAGKIKLMLASLETLGTKADMARRFYEKLPEYILEPRYLGVVQAGRDAMDAFLLGGAGDAGAHGGIKGMMKEWNRPASEKKPSLMTVMFTDMVGSTDLTQEKGDQAAQEIVRRHNAIVRGALAQYSGREVKHTGDGIMASFDSAINAVEATVAIQRQVLSNNERNPELELHLRIGLNAGEPIQEEDDLFGTTVQLAARVCAATNSDQILCTSVVKDLSFGKGGTFSSAGERRLKGFKDVIELFEIGY